VAQLARQARAAASGSGWIFIVAALSAVNTVIGLVGVDVSFLFGLGFTQLIDVFGLAMAEGSPGLAFVIRAVATVLSLGAAAVMAIFGFLGRRRMTWAFLVVLGGYLLDTGISLFFEDWLGALFHVAILFLIGRGAWASFQLNKLMAGMPDAQGNIHPT
jgi:hypothetical protein